MAAKYAENLRESTLHRYGQLCNLSSGRPGNLLRNKDKKPRSPNELNIRVSVVRLTRIDLMSILALRAATPS
jgi:hypothetical protein